MDDEEHSGIGDRKRSFQTDVIGYPLLIRFATEAREIVIRNKIARPFTGALVIN